MNTILKLLLIVTVSFLLLYFGSVLFVPMLYGLLIAFVMYPYTRWMEARGWSRSVSISISLCLVFLLVLLIAGLLVWQVHVFREDLPGLVTKMKPALSQFREWLETKFAISLKMQDEWLHQIAMSSGERVTLVVSSILNATVSTLVMLFLVPVYAALFLFHRRVFVRFSELVAGEVNRLRVQAILQQTILTYSSYIKGMVAVYFIVGVLNSVGLLVLGIENAILFGMLTAVMTIVPYVGIFISALLPISVAYITKDSLLYPLGVIAVFSFVQYLEANVIFPSVVGKHLNVSTWATLVAIILGGIIWGVSGMILFIPFVAILKIVAEHIPEWRALHVLLSREG